MKILDTSIFEKRIFFFLPVFLTSLLGAEHPGLHTHDMSAGTTQSCMVASIALNDLSQEEKRSEIDMGLDNTLDIEMTVMEDVPEKNKIKTLSLNLEKEELDKNAVDLEKAKRFNKLYMHMKAGEICTSLFSVFFGFPVILIGERITRNESNGSSLNDYLITAIFLLFDYLGDMHIRRQKANICPIVPTCIFPFINLFGFGFCSFLFAYSIYADTEGKYRRDDFELCSGYSLISSLLLDTLFSFLDLPYVLCCEDAFMESVEDENQNRKLVKFRSFAWNYIKPTVRAGLGLFCMGYSIRGLPKPESFVSASALCVDGFFLTATSLDEIVDFHVERAIKDNDSVQTKRLGKAEFIFATLDSLCIIYIIIIFAKNLFDMSPFDMASLFILGLGVQFKLIINFMEGLSIILHSEYLRQKENQVVKICGFCNA